MRSRPKVLILAESANPEQSSSSLVGWSLSRALREYADVHVVTHVRNRDALEKAGWREGREYTAIDPGTVERPIVKVGGAIGRAAKLGWTWTTVLSTLSYYYFERLVWQRFAQPLRDREFDLVHRITPVSPATPSPIVAHCQDVRVPFVWGPMNGGVPWPKEFREAQRREGEWLSYVRSAHRFLPAHEVTRSGAAALITGSICVWEEMRKHHDRCVYLPENAIDPSRFQVAAPPPKEGPFRVAFVGRLVPLKGVDMLIDAAAPLVRSGRMVLDIIGDGPEMPALRRQAADAGLAGGVNFTGWIDHVEVAGRLARAHVFAFPSIREFGGGVILEAMALGLPSIVVNHGGPGELVTDDTGFRIPIGPRQSIVDAFREILTTLAQSPERTRGLGERARERVCKLFTWDVKARQVLEIYRWVLKERPDKPNFGMPLQLPAA